MLETENPKSKKINIFLIIIFTLIVLFGGGYLFLRTFLSGFVKIDPENLIMSRKTYSNSHYGFSFEYPNDWYLFEFQGEKLSGNEVGVSSFDKNNPQTDYIDEAQFYVDFKTDSYNSSSVYSWFDQYLEAEEKSQAIGPNLPTLVSRMEINGYPAVKTLEHSPGLLNANKDIYFFKKNSLIFQITIEASKEDATNKEKAEAILNSLRFTN